MSFPALHLVLARAIALAAALLTHSLVAQAADPEVPATGEVALFTFFRDNGQAGLYLAWSGDGFDWHELTPPGTSFLAPEVGGKLMRDPCLLRAPDGRFHMVWTTGWNDRAIGYASSTNLLQWSPQRSIPVMAHEPTARNCWAPELFFDASRGEFLIFWATTIPGRFAGDQGTSDDRYDHRIYGVRTRDFREFTDTALFYDGGFNVIDATLVRADSRCALIVKDETLRPERKHLRIAWAEDPRGPFGPASEPFTPSWVEGPSALNVGGTWIVYFDHYRHPQYYGAMCSTDLRRWEDCSSRVKLPRGARHGTALSVPASIVRALTAPRP